MKCFYCYTRRLAKSPIIDRRAHECAYDAADDAVTVCCGYAVCGHHIKDAVVGLTQ